MGTKMAVSFANIFMALTETKLIQQSETKHREWKCCVDDVLFSISLADRDFFFNLHTLPRATDQT